MIIIFLFLYIYKIYIFIIFIHYTIYKNNKHNHRNCIYTSTIIFVQETQILIY